MEVKRIQFNDVEALVKLGKRERVTFANPPGALWWGVFLQEKIVACAALVVKQGKRGLVGRFKSDYVLPEYRGKGVYRAMFQARLEDAVSYGLVEGTAFCTPMSVHQYNKSGFETISMTGVKGDIAFVRAKFKG